MAELRFDGRTAIVTGAGRGLGRAHALLLAARGASVVVNDLGSETDGAGASNEPAHEVVEEITAAGGAAVASLDSVADADGATAIVKKALDNFGQIDIVVNNAGIFHATPFAELTMERFRAQWEVHLLGTVQVTTAAWPYMVHSGYGRVVNTVSAGMLGMLGLTDYGAAKGAVFGFTNNLALEGIEHGIRVNAVAPGAATRMGAQTEATIDPDVLAQLKAVMTPDKVSPVVAYLAHESCSLNGEILNAAAGNVSRLQVVTTAGYSDPDLTPERVAEHLDEILDTSRTQAMTLPSAAAQTSS